MPLVTHETHTAVPYHLARPLMYAQTNTHTYLFNQHNINSNKKKTSESQGEEVGVIPQQ